MSDPPQPYKCRQCRCVLFLSNHILHNNMRDNENNSTSHQACSSVFLNELENPDPSIIWLHNLMTSASLSGRILCPTPTCQAKVGVWNWIGSKCSCGYWAVPAIQFHANKLDPPILLTSKLSVVSAAGSVFKFRSMQQPELSNVQTTIVPTTEEENDPIEIESTH